MTTDSDQSFLRRSGDDEGTVILREDGVNHRLDTPDMALLSPRRVERDAIKWLGHMFIDDKALNDFGDFLWTRWQFVQERALTAGFAKRRVLCVVGEDVLRFVGFFPPIGGSGDSAHGWTSCLVASCFPAAVIVRPLDRVCSASPLSAFDAPYPFVGERSYRIGGAY
jgi:hypothetical protein